MQQINIKQLLQKYKEGTLTPDEQVLLENWYLQWQPDGTPLQPETLMALETEVWQNLNRGMGQRKIIRFWPRMAAAAALIFCLGIVGYLYFKPKLQVKQQYQTAVPDVKPGGSKATLILANGQKILLATAQNGQIANQGNMQVTKAKNGQLIYTLNKYAAAPVTKGSEAAYNIIEIPRGGTYRVILPDGTSVWINSASTLKYPVVFSGGQRRVELTGEAYFEVAHNKAMPFRVSVMGQTVEDLGTEFNINAYTDEPQFKTTLIAGKVSIAKGGSRVNLTPGQQALTNAGTTGIQVSNVDTEAATAWKNGYFVFENENLAAIMRRVAKWYDVEIVYPEGDPLSGAYIGSITRYSKVSQVLEMLQITGKYRFKIDGKRIIINRK